MGRNIDIAHPILVTGANGYIGRNLVAQLKSNGYRVNGIGSQECDVTNNFELVATVNRIKPSMIFHLAGVTGVEESWVDPCKFYNVNVVGTQCVLDACRQFGARMVFVSAYLYGGNVKQPVSEDSPISPMNPYAHTKYLGEQLCEFYYEHYGVATVIVRPFNVYGGKQSNRFLIPSIIEQLVSDSKSIVLKDLEPIRDYIYICDIVSALVKLVEFDTGYEIFNVGTGKGYTVEQVVDLIQSVWGIQKTVETLYQRRENEISTSVANVEKIVKLLGWYPGYSLNEGLLEMYKCSSYRS